jgi:hypothetical protein
VPAVGRDSDAVDPGAAHDGHAPAALGSGPQDGEGVVVDEGALRPAARLDRLAQLLLVAREVDAGHVQLRDLGGPFSTRFGVQLVEHLQRLGQAKVPGRALRAAHERPQRAVGIDQREVRLRGAAVDRND